MQYKAIEIAFIFFLVLFSTKGNAGLSFKLEKPLVEKKTEVFLDKSLSVSTPKIVDPQFVLDKSNIVENEKVILLSLSRLNLILKNEKKIDNIISIHTNRIICFIQLARISRIKSGGKALVSEEEKYLKKSLNLIKQIKLHKISNELIGKMYYFEGLINLDMGKKGQSQQSFEKAIEVYPKSIFTPSLALYLADLYYEAGDLPKAMKGYKRFYSVMNNQERDLADYKMAWIHLNLSEIEPAVDLFLSMIEKSNSKSIVQDSLISVSVALSEKFDQDVILSKLEKSNVSESTKVKILWAIYDNFLQQPKKERLKIWERISKSESSNDAIVKLISSELQMMELGVNIGRDIYILKIIKIYLNANHKKIKGFSGPLIVALGQQLESLISKSLTLNQEHGSDKIYEFLKTTIDIYLKENIFSRHLEVTSLLLELLIEKNSDKELMNLCKEILTDPQYITLRNRAKFLALLDFEKQFLNDQDKYREKFFILGERYLADLKAEQWDKVAQKFYEYFIKSGHNKEAEKTIEALNQNYPNEDNFLKLVSVKFELRKCEEVLSILSRKKVLVKKLADYKRECYLTIAQESKKENTSFVVYQQNIQNFIALSEGAKRNAAIADYLNTLELVNLKEVKEKKDLEVLKDFQEVFEHQYYNARFEKELFPIYQREILNLVEHGEFSKAQLYLKDCEKNQLCSSLVPLMLNLQNLESISQTRNEKSDDFFIRKIDSDLGKYLPLISPEVIIDIYNKKNITKKMDPRILLVAARLSLINWADDAYKEIYKQIVSLLTKDEKPYTLSRLWIQLDKINFPKGNSRHKLQDQQVMNLIKKVQDSRNVVLSDLGQYSIISQRNLLNKAIEVEIRMSEVIQLSPIPGNVDPAKVGEYQQGLKQLAEEFDTQSISYKKLLSSFDQVKNPPLLNVIDELKAPSSVENWSWGTVDLQSEKIKQFVREESYIKALYYLDYLRSISKISTEDYYSRRSGVLIFSAVKRAKVKPMIQYVWDECDIYKQQKVIMEWQQWSKK